VLVLFCIPGFDCFLGEHRLEGSALEGVIAVSDHKDIIVAGVTGLHKKGDTFSILCFILFLVYSFITTLFL